jgi:hypothetical protein
LALRKEIQLIEKRDVTEKSYATTEVFPCFIPHTEYKNYFNHSKCEYCLNNMQEEGTYFQEKSLNIIIHFEVNSGNDFQE